MTQAETGKKREGGTIHTRAHAKSAQKRTEKRETLTDAAVLFLEEPTDEE